MLLDLDSENCQSKKELNSTVQLDRSSGTLLMVHAIQHSAGLSKYIISMGLPQPSRECIKLRQRRQHAACYLIIDISYYLPSSDLLFCGY